MAVTVSHPAEYLPYDLKIIGLNPAQVPNSQDIYLIFFQLFKLCRNAIEILLENVLDFLMVNFNNLKKVYFHDISMTMAVTVSHPAEYLPYDLEIIGLNPAQVPKSPYIYLNVFNSSNFVKTPQRSC